MVGYILTAKYLIVIIECMFLYRSTHTVVNPSIKAPGMIGSFTHFPDIGNLSPSLGLGAIGMPGYFVCTIV